MEKDTWVYILAGIIIIVGGLWVLATIVDGIVN